MFYISQLKPVVGNVYLEYAIDVAGYGEYDIGRIVDTRVIHGSKEYLIQWKGYTDFENSWVKAVDIGSASELVD